MSSITVDKDLCLRDGICVAECPGGLLELPRDAATPTMIAGAESRCLTCGHCVAVCPHGALSLDSMAASACPPVEPELALTPAHVEHLVRSRRSVRVFRNEKVDLQALSALIEVARYAPTGGNSQLVDWLVVDSPEEVQRLAALCVDLLRQMIASGHPMGERYNLGEWVAAWDAGADPILRKAPALVVAHAPTEYSLAQVDCAIALSSLELAAPSFGLGTCWAGLFMMADTQWRPLQDALALPQGHACMGAMMIGRARHSYHRLPLRSEPRVTWWRADPAAAAGDPTAPSALQ